MKLRDSEPLEFTVAAIAGVFLGALVLFMILWTVEGVGACLGYWEPLDRNHACAPSTKGRP